MRKGWLYVLLLTVAVSATSCRKAIEKAQRDIRIEAVENLERKGFGGARIDVRMANDTGYKLVLKEARLGLFFGSVEVMNMTLHGRIEIPRRTTYTFSSLWRVRTEDPMSYYVMTKKIGEGDISQVGVSFSMKGRGGPASVKIEEPMMPLSEFLNIFGFTLGELQQYLEE